MVLVKVAKLNEKVQIALTDDIPSPHLGVGDYDGKTSGDIVRDTEGIPLV